MIEQNTAGVEVRIAELYTEKHLPNEVRDSKVQELRNSIISERGNDSSFKVVTSIANTMIGSSIIVYPIMFIKDGIIGSLLVLLAIGAALFFTCRLLLIHNRPDEQDFGIQIKRILGARWAKLNSIVNIVLLFVVSIAYFMLIQSNFFDITAAIFHEINGYQIPKVNTITFDKYSVQYASIIAISFTSLLICKRDIQFLMKFFKFTIYSVFAYGLFILVSFIRVLAQGTLNFDDYIPFNPDFSTVAGAFALSLLLHPVAAPILKRNIRQQNNQRDLLLGYLLTAMIYVFVGFIGGLTCAGSVKEILSKEHADKYNTVFDCVKKGADPDRTQIIFFIIGKVVQLGIFIQNLSVMPILSFLTRKQFIDQFKQQNKQKAFYAYNMAIICLCLVVTFFEVDVSIVLSLNGAIVGFFMAYAIPIASHLTCYHRKLKDHQRLQRSQLLLSMDTDDQTRDEALKCNNHPPRSLLRHGLIYGGLLGMGFAVALFKLLALFQ